MEELETVYVIETSKGLYVIEDEIVEGNVLDGILELAVRFESIEEAENFLQEMTNVSIGGKIRKAKIYIEVV
ncbi:hypothetical protein [Priestia aryabhattai]|uniref:hypothetical protein n=1 Tax=Priestia aryabhattai TaxID=412384 RepID=UPI003D2DA7EF